MAQLVIDIPDELAQSLEQAASERHSTVATFVIENLTTSIAAAKDERITFEEIEEFRRSIREARLSSGQQELSERR